MRIHLSVAMVVLSASLLSPASFPQKPAVDAEGHPWWQHAVFYEIYPRSFADSNNDGIGDLNGITAKLNYVKKLGVDAIWITPCFPSPQVDFGYDVSDYEAIDPMYGTLAEFDKLSAAAKKDNIRIILDFVVNHSSDQHKWFLDSKSSRTSAHRDWYIWRDGKGPNRLPNNWTSTFGTPAWTYDATTNQYYYHYFYPEQPDLNWRNPAVEKAMFDTTRFWYQRGVAGFRLDAVDTLYEREDLKDNPPAPGLDKFGRPNTEEKYNKKLPEIHGALQRLRKVADENNAVLIGETWTSDVSQLAEYYGPNNNELQMPMDLLLNGLPSSATAYRAHVNAMDASGHWPVYVMNNHDTRRSYSRYANGKNDDAIAKLVAAFYLTLRGTAILYYGEELGMENNDPKTKDEVQDPVGKLSWPTDKGRDGERTPMQWSDAANGGFSTTKPWLPVPSTAKTHNVTSEEKDPHSVLETYRSILALRHNLPALVEGDYHSINNDDPNVFAYVRRYKNEEVLVVLNFSDKSQEAQIAELAAGYVSLLSSGAKLADGHKSIMLEPFGFYIAKLTK
ncbi:MAG TPA: alpha-glucosidase [Candidatus Acidoferrum sp.]